MKETVELITGEVYSSVDHWVTVYWRKPRRPGSRATKPVLVTDKEEADRIRYIAVVQHGGGRNER